MATIAAWARRDFRNECDPYGRGSQPQGCGALHRIGMYFASLAVLALHLLDIVKHAFIDRDTAMLARMWGK